MVPARTFRDLTAGAYARAGVPREVALVVPSFTAAAAVVAQTDLVATLPHSLFEVLAPRLGIRTLRAPIPPLFVTMKLGWHERTHADAAAVGFRDLLRRAVLALPAVRQFQTRAMQLPRRAAGSVLQTSKRKPASRVRASR
jgi:DNA-binding transcriptional LysR family regulator